jgi:hypothetical protein
MRRAAAADASQWRHCSQAATGATDQMYYWQHNEGEVLGVRFALGEARLRVRVRVEARITQHGRR